ncbi:MAG: S-methyl-5-thioribose-1-phosphate isomerase [Pseudobutyrivibrio sp.]|nr:S-methyl-5-thioribose-1-phosphate isomerase [Pseudobutyrivibrio sp.]
MNLMEIDTVSLSADDSSVVIIDQTLLPGKIELLNLVSSKDIWDAIYHLKVRGAPAIGICAAIGMYVLSRSYDHENLNHFVEQFMADMSYLDSARPTAVNLSWALKQMGDVVINYQQTNVDNVDNLVNKLKEKATYLKNQDIHVCKTIGEYGLTLIKPGDGILTHCNAGKLATIKYGTATAPIYAAHERGYNLKVFCDETRPLLQGARLTAFELTESGVDTTLICDNMSAMVMKKGWIDAVFVGCDRVAANGDTANKIGTSVVATVAKQYNVPMYICAPTSTIDMDTACGDDIVIEERKAEEITDMWYTSKMSHKDVKVYNPAFDITDHSLIAGIITEYGIARPPYNESLNKIIKEKENARK